MSTFVFSTQYLLKYIYKKGTQYLLEYFKNYQYSVLTRVLFFSTHFMSATYQDNESNAVGYFLSELIV